MFQIDSWSIIYWVTSENDSVNLEERKRLSLYWGSVRNHERWIFHFNVPCTCRMHSHSTRLVNNSIDNRSMRHDKLFTSWRKFYFFSRLVCAWGILSPGCYNLSLSLSLFPGSQVSNLEMQVLGKCLNRVSRLMMISLVLCSLQKRIRRSTRRGEYER